MGVASKPFGNDRVEDRDGNILLDNEFNGKQVIDPASCYVLIDVLKKVMKYGTGIRARLDRPCAGKTGTTDDYTNAWFCGFTPDLTTVIYIGYDNPVSMGKGRSGGRVAGPIWHDFMENSLKDTPKNDFSRPENVIDVDICADSGLLATQYCPNTYKQSFVKGTEPKNYCNFHSLDNSFATHEEDHIQKNNYPSFDEYLKLKKESGEDGE